MNTTMFACGTRTFCASVLLAALSATGAEYYWVPGATDWRAKESYANADGTAAGKVPSSGDELAIPENCTVTLDCDNAAHFEIANKLERIRPFETTSFFVVKVSEGKEVTFAPKINFNNAWSYAGWYKGGLVKRGLGTLVLGSGTGHHDYMTDITVEEGTLKLPQATSANAWRYYDLIAVSNGATLFTCATADKSGKTLTAPLGLIGEGTVTNDCNDVCYLEMLGSGRNWSHEFAGRLTGNIMLNNGRTHFYLTGTNNTFRGIMAIRENLDYPLENVMIGLKKIGKKADQESSAGINHPTYGLGFRDVCLWNRNHGSGYLYLGEGETTDKDFYVHAGGYDSKNKIEYLQAEEPNFFNAGAKGGVTFTGEFKIADAYNQRFILTGSNTSECVIAGPIRKYVEYTTPRTNYNWRFTKKGTGIWRFADVANTEMAGVFAVENGTLRYDSIAEKGTLCALGYSNLLLEDYTGKIDDTRQVDYAFELGSTTDVLADPIFEYTGSSKGWCFTRPLAMKGSARLRHSGGGELRLAKLRTLNDSAKTLTLDGDGENAWLYNVCDEYGKLSLVKDGNGTWNICGTNQISGSVSVKGGTLNLQNHKAPYTWFKWTHKSTCGKWETVDLELGLYAEDGVRANSNLAYHNTPVLTTTSMISMAEGTVAVACEGFINNAADMVYLFDNFIDTTQAKQWVTAYRPKGEGTWRRSSVDDPTSWYSIIMRLPANSPKVATYDIISWGDWSYRNGCASQAFALEGSNDGVNWYAIDDYDAGEGATPGGNATTWRFSKQTYGNGDAQCPVSDLINHSGGREIDGCPQDLPAVLANVTEISVAAGARLAVTGGDAVELRDGITLTVDASTGAGTLANMILPENGTLNLVNVPEYSGSLEMSISGENVTGLDNISGWNISINGVAQSSSKRKCRYANGKIVVYNPGTVVVFR